MFSFAVISLLTTVAVAQSSTTTANPLIPTGISPACTAYLQAFNSGTTFSSCLNALTTATKAFAPGNNATSADVTTALSSLCSSATTNACQASTIRTELAKFYSACTTELTSGKNQDVIRIYDVFYGFTPMQQALCTTNDDGSYCVKLASQYSQTAQSSGKSISYTPVAGGLTPNVTTIGKNNLPFMYLNPNTPSSLLCTTCPRKIFVAWTNAQSSMQYAPGLANSPTMAGQTSLYNAFVSTCGTNFLSGAVQAAGSLSGGSSGGSTSAALSTVADMKIVVAVGLGIVTALASFN